MTHTIHIPKSLSNEHPDDPDLGMMFVSVDEYYEKIDKYCKCDGVCKCDVKIKSD